MKGKDLDARTLRWVASRAIRSRLVLALYPAEQGFNSALELIAKRCREKAKNLESAAKKKATSR